jgi:hypothetical protein
MIIIFYSEKCNSCKNILNYIENNNLKNNFTLKYIDNDTLLPDYIKIVPTLIDSSIELHLEGQKVYEYIINQKYFFHPTNNIDYWINTSVPKPSISEDEKAIEKHNFGFSSFNDKEITTPIEVKKQIPIITDKKMLTLLKLRR